MSANNINAFCIDPTERYVYAGTKSGQLLTIDIDNFKIVDAQQAHYGSIETVAIHPSLPYVGMLGKDQVNSIWTFEDPAKIRLQQLINVREISPADEKPILPFQSTSQALAFHDAERRFVGHSGNAGMVEIRFDDHGWELIRCTRPHGQYDFVTSRYVVGTDRILSASVRGEVILSEAGEILAKWDLGVHNNRQAIHWFEHLEGDIYLVASDGQQVLRFDVSGKVEPLHGPLIARDHLEHVTLNRTSGRAFCASFDRLVHEVSTETVESLGIVWKAPFKLRWVKTLERDPNSMIVNCRDGGLHKVNINLRTSIACIKNTPNCIWTGVKRGSDILLAGEGNYRRRLVPAKAEPTLRLPRFQEDVVPFPSNQIAYTKRAAASPDGRVVVFGRTNGEIFLEERNEIKLLVQLSDPVRDLSFSNSGDHVFVAVEDGTVRKIDAVTGAETVIYRAATPIWALAVHPEQEMLALAHRVNEIRLLDLTTLEARTVVTGTRFCKRLRWIDEDRLLIGSGGNIWVYSLTENSHRVLVGPLMNTVEDFDWTEDRRYIVVTSYTRQMYLADGRTGVIIDTIGHEMDYGKGVLFLRGTAKKSDYAGDFVAFGRDGVPSHFRVHDDRIIPFGPITSPSWTHNQEDRP